MGDFYNYGLGGMFGFGGIFMIIFWGLIIWGIIALVRGNSHGSHCGHGEQGGYNDHDRKNEDKSMAILNERYAKGEISKQEYEGKKKDILN